MSYECDCCRKLSNIQPYKVCPDCFKTDHQQEPHPEHAEGSSLGEVTRLLDRALSLLTDIEVAQVFDGVQMAVVPVDMKQLDRIAKLVEGVEIDLPMTGEGEGR